MPRKIDPEDKERMWKRFQLKHTETKVRKYKLVFTKDKSEHLIIISQEDKWYTIEVKLSKAMTDVSGDMRRDFGIKAQDLELIKKSTRNFLESIGEYVITPLG